MRLVVGPLISSVRVARGRNVAGHCIGVAPLDFHLDRRVVDVKLLGQRSGHGHGWPPPIVCSATTT